jgi:(S)-2-hydroxyglutarate dehydrogenase
VPFRGEYYLLREDRRHLVSGLVYPVPDPRYPFLGVHVTPRVDGEVMVGPNAVMAFAREGYRRRTVSVRDLADAAAWPGFRRFARQHWRTGVEEMAGSLSRRRFVAAARRYVPDLTVDDVVPGPSGIRAQALGKDGSLVDDFRMDRRGHVVALRNAPSPAATSSLAIAEHLVDMVLDADTSEVSA